MGTVFDVAGGANEWAIGALTDPMDLEVDGSLASMMSVGSTTRFTNPAALYSAAAHQVPRPCG